MSASVGENLHDKINQYKKLVEQYQDTIKQAKHELNEKQKNIEEKVLNIVSNRNLSTKERTEKMIPLMEKQDRLKDFAEEMETLVIKEN